MESSRSYADYLKEYQAKVGPIQKQRLDAAKKAKLKREKAGIDISIARNVINPEIIRPDKPNPHG